MKSSKNCCAAFFIEPSVLKLLFLHRHTINPPTRGDMIVSRALVVLFSLAVGMMMSSFIRMSSLTPRLQLSPSTIVLLSAGSSRESAAFTYRPFQQSPVSASAAADLLISAPLPFLPYVSHDSYSNKSATLTLRTFAIFASVVSVGSCRPTSSRAM